MDKYEIAQTLREIGIIIELIDVNPKKAIAYSRAANTIESVPNITEIIDSKSLETLPGIGKKISEMIYILVKNNSLPYYEHLKTLIPKDLLEFAQLPGQNLRKVRILYEALFVTNIDQLEQVLKDGKTIKVKGLGLTFTKNMISSLPFLKTKRHSILYPKALRRAHALIEILGKYTNKIEITGALRRKLETLKELDLIATTDDKEKCFSIFTKHGLIREVLSTNKDGASVLLKQGIVANLNLVEEDEYYRMLVKTTGNEEHLNELQKEPLKDEKIHSENDLYRAYGLPFIVPELREGLGEVAAAKNNKLPILIEEKDLRGTFHCHTLDSDGTNTIEELANAARNMGWEYIGIADHSKASYQAHGMSEERLFSQIENISKFNAQLDPSFRVFSGIECDILKDGTLDFSNEVLAKLDYVIVSIHRRFKLEEKEMTERLLKAIENPYTTMIGHLTGRILLHRHSYKIDVQKVIDACIANNKIMELNAHPNRLDMDWRLWIKAKDKGLKCSINPDAHSLKDLMNCQYGINMARKGWLEKKDVVNTLPLEEMKIYLKTRKTSLN